MLQKVTWKDKLFAVASNILQIEKKILTILTSSCRMVCESVEFHLCSKHLLFGKNNPFGPEITQAPY